MSCPREPQSVAFILPGLSRDGRDPVHLLHHAPLLHLHGPLPGHREPTVALQGSRHQEEVRAGLRRLLDRLAAHGVHTGVHGDLLVAGAPLAGQVRQSSRYWQNQLYRLIAAEDKRFVISEIVFSLVFLQNFLSSLRGTYDTNAV